MVAQMTRKVWSCVYPSYGKTYELSLGDIDNVYVNATRGLTYTTTYNIGEHVHMYDDKGILSSMLVESP